jgi:hypothetical protein
MPHIAMATFSLQLQQILQPQPQILSASSSHNRSSRRRKRCSNIGNSSVRSEKLPHPHLQPDLERPHMFGSVSCRLEFVGACKNVVENKRKIGEVVLHPPSGLVV